MNQDTSSYDKRFGFIAYGLLFLAIFVSTCLHQFQPQILRVPDNRTPGAWHNPTLDQTLLADNLRADRRARFLEEGVPLGTALGTQFASDLFTILLAGFCFVHARKHFGFWMAS